MTLEDAIRLRRSIRRYRDDKPARELVEKLLEMAVHAPSASNKQPWRFFVVDERATIERMAAAVENAVQKITSHIEPRFADAFRAYGDYFVRFREAPVVIVPAFRELVVLSNLVDAATSAEDRETIRTMEFNSGLISTSLALQNLMLYAHSIGLGSSCMTGPLVAARGIKALLGIPESWHLAACVPVGYPAESPQPVGRKSVDTVVRWIDGEGA
ncbi:MAG TPA: nitroreductase family protein [Burkholderiales bacterium]|nr:nitroreductase family protein [Burkholderiales bacterium]